MLYRLRQNVSRWRFETACSDIYATPPLRPNPAPLTIVTMLARTDLTMYLIAVKSLYRRLGEGKVLVLDDGSLREEDRATLRRQVPGVDIRALAAQPMGQCPRGGCWERLVWIMELSRDAYVLQVDSDTVTRGEIDEVLECVRANRSFTLGGPRGREIVPLERAHESIQGVASEHVQILAERALHRLPGSERRRYVRGGAAFAGFARGAFCRERLEAFAVEMGRLVGDRWRQWGSEQVASNFMIANAPEARVLPYPKYCSFESSLDHSASAFLHFIGCNRFDGGVYIEEARAAIRGCGSGR